MSTVILERLSVEDLEAESGAVLPAKEVLSVPLLDLNVDIDLALDLAAPIDLAVAGNANVVLPVNAGVSANALALLSGAQAGAEQGVGLEQYISGSAIAHGGQTSGIDQTGGGGGADASVGALAAPATQAGVPDNSIDHAQPVDDQPAGDTGQAVTEAAQPAADTGQAVTEAAQPVAADTTQPTAAAADPEPAAAVTTPDPTDPSLAGGLLNVDVNLDLDAKLAAPIAGAVALNANVAAPINGSVAANVGTLGSEAIAISDQTALISQQMENVTAEATTDQTAEIDQ